MLNMQIETSDSGFLGGRLHIHLLFVSKSRVQILKLQVKLTVTPFHLFNFYYAFKVSRSESDE